MAQQGTMNQASGSTSGAGFAIFAGIMMVTVGIFQAFQGIAALINGSFFVVGSNYTYSIDISSWGWIHTIVGTIVALAGFAVFSGKVWARAVGITLAIISAVVNFLYIPYYPFWSILIIALDMGVIWGLAVYNGGEGLAD